MLGIIVKTENNPKFIVGFILFHLEKSLSSLGIVFKLFFHITNKKAPAVECGGEQP